MDKQSKYDIPWELIADFLTGNFSDEQNDQLQQWIAMNNENRATFDRIRELWRNGTGEYLLYKKADENEAWKDLQNKISGDKNTGETKVIRVDFTPKRKILRNVLAIASVCIGLLVVLWYFKSHDTADVYITGTDANKKISLADGTVISLHPLTRIEVRHTFNKTDRSVIMKSGEADFDVVHRADMPFIVQIGEAEIRDIGTRFNIRRETGMIHVAVTDGKVAFVTNRTHEARELEAGSSVSFNEQSNRFGEINSIESSEAFRNWLDFENTPLTEVVQSIQKVYAKHIEIGDHIGNRKLTAKLYGMPFDTAIEVICSSLDLEYAVQDSVYVLKARVADEQVK
ncbi:MAG TPA: FecR domain-containing protein [Bacteroidales bacterium]|nr:FecR domain-containing protein [Bacteroidales bacterium]